MADLVPKILHISIQSVNSIKFNKYCQGEIQATSVWRKNFKNSTEVLAV